MKAIWGVNGGTPIAGWLIQENPNLKWMRTRGTRISGNLHITSFFNSHAIHIAIGFLLNGSKVGELETLASWATTGPRPAICPCTCEAVGFFGLANG